MTMFPKLIVLTAILSGLGPIVATPARAADAPPQCLRSSDIKSTKATDDSTLLFYMRDHKIWANHLQSPCLGLTNDGFTYQAEPNDVICGNVETIRTVQFPTICKLGAFTSFAKP